jgi:uncharacterized membrane protein affecting hemolysin expression
VDTRKPARVRYPLAFKLTVIMAALVITAAGSITLLSLNRQQSTFRAELQQRADALLSSMIAAGANDLYRLDRSALQGLSKALSDTGSILDGQVYDAKGQLIVNSAILMRRSRFR